MMEHPRSKFLELLSLKVLDIRLRADHPEKEKVRSDLKIKYAELKGEREVAYTLDFLDKSKFVVMHNLRLPDHNGHFQIDTLILTEKVFLVVEVKNWQGTVIFSENGQVTRIPPDGSEEGYKNPVDQAETQSYRLQQWLLQHNLSDIPFEYLVVISFPKTIIKPSSPNVTIPHEVIHNSKLIFRVQEIVSKYDKQIRNMGQLKRLAKTLADAHVPPKNILSKYNFTDSDLIKGVFCPECGTVLMTKINTKWHCKQCEYSSDEAYKYALLDYRLFYGDWITNKIAREFLLIASPTVVQRILKKVCKTAEGKNRWRRYQLDYRKLKLDTKRKALKERVSR
ncbi:NERD domain-containing protein [Oceanobacillus halophilus]|uniref:NERD domain-containing protein n=1 Tax=Oceanobacillus halophilus TaxID=930130 RepID=A0A495A423_9BACI|nr:NERD domain-containing protein [Oceanobacillus halophilus]RKQ34345.1 hypothetical protein D8M06_08190 [Oceanobacillus halophilus]